MKKPIVYIDLDGVCADFDKAFPLVAEKEWVEGSEKKVPEGFFCDLEPIEGAVDALHTLAGIGLDLYFLSTPQWSNPNCWKEKRLWVEKHYGELMFKRLILTHHKYLLKGDYLIDDRKVNGNDKFEGKFIHFGSEEFPDWNAITRFFVDERMKEVKNSLKKTLHSQIDRMLR